MKLFELNGQDGQSQNQNPALRQVALARLRVACPLLEHLEFYQIKGSSDAPPKPSTASGGNVRAINSDFSNNPVDPTFGSVALKIWGDKVQTDKAWERRGVDIDSQRVADVDAFAERMGWDLQDRLINDTTSATKWSGIRSLVPAVNKLVFDTENGGALPLGNSSADKKQQQKFLEFVRRVLNYVGPGAIIVWNADVAARIESIFYEYVRKTDVKNAVEEMVEVTRFRGATAVDAGYKKDGETMVMGNAETVGTSDDCSSMLILKPGEKRDLTGASNVGLVVDDLGLQGVHYETSMEADIGLELLRDRALYEIQGIRLNG